MISRYLSLIVLAFIECTLVSYNRLPAQEWTHPAGFITSETVEEIGRKVVDRQWAARLYAARKQANQAWVEMDIEELREHFPKTRGNVYHNFSCPDHKVSLTFDPFNRTEFTCPLDGAVFDPETDAGIYSPTHHYHGTLLDGWENKFYSVAAGKANELALMGLLDDDRQSTDRAIELLFLFEETIKSLPKDMSGMNSRILTYHREGDNKILFDLAIAYELVRDNLDAKERARIEENIIQRMLDDVMLDPFHYDTDWNNVYQWHLTVLQCALALEREDLVDWVFGYGEHADHPTHRHLKRIIETHFMEDGGFWELCSGYHLYPVNHFCSLAVVSRNLSRMDPGRFPPEKYDFTDPGNPGSRVIHAALEWFVAMAMPDRTTTTVGNNSKSRESMKVSYTYTAEVGYRYFGVLAVGDYAGLRDGSARGWEGLLVGAPEIVRHDGLPFKSSYLNSGWISLRGETATNRAWFGLNALRPGGSHQHADRLSLVSYSHGQLLGTEKGVPSNEPAIRALGGQSQSHNTVTIDMTSMPDISKGNWIERPDYSEESPPVRVTHFHDTEVVSFARLNGDALSDQTDVYRRSVAVIGDLAVDYFEVEGGRVHDWIFNHLGSRPEFSMEVQPAQFEPSEWLLNGTDNVLKATTASNWEARWLVEDVTSRLTMLGARGTEVYSLETFPTDNGRITSKHPPTQTLCVRRTYHRPFLAVWDAWKVAPTLRAASAGDRDGAVRIEMVDGEAAHLLFGPGSSRFEDGVTVSGDGALSLWRGDKIAFIGGTWIEVGTSEGSLRVETDQPIPASLSLEYAVGSIVYEIAGDIHYVTRAGRDIAQPAPSTRPIVTGDLWRAESMNQALTVRE